MAKKSSPKSTYSVRLDYQTIKALRARATEQHQTAGAVIRNLIDDFLDTRDTEDILGNMESRIVATINRVSGELWEAKQEADLTLGMADFTRSYVCLMYLKTKHPTESNDALFRKGSQMFRMWRQKYLDERVASLLKPEDGLAFFETEEGSAEDETDETEP